MLLNARLSDTIYSRADHDVHLITLPLFHCFGQTVQMNAGIYNRASLVLLPRFSPDAALRLMSRSPPLVLPVTTAPMDGTVATNWSPVCCISILCVVLTSCSIRFQQPSVTKVTT